MGLGREELVLNTWKLLSEILGEAYRPGSYEIVDTTTGNVVQTAGNRMDASDDCAYLNKQVRARGGKSIYSFRPKKTTNEAGWGTGWRRNSIWDRATELERQPQQQQQPAQGSKPQGPKPAATGAVVWRGAQFKDTELFTTKKHKDTGKNIEGGLIPALKEKGATISRAPDGSGIALIPHGYRIDTTVWKDWSSNRSRAEINATTDSVKGMPTPSAKGATPTYDVLMQARSSGEGESPSILVTKVVWAPLDRSSVEGQQPDARQAKLELLMDTDDPSELAQMFPAPAKGPGLERPQPSQELPPNPLMAPSKVTFTKGGASAPAARDSAWQDIDLARVPKRKG